MNNKIEYLLHRLVMEMDRAADKILLDNLQLSYKRCQVLAIVQHSGTLTQHELATILGHSDPAVSKMLAELSKNGYVTIIIDPNHARKRLVSLTSKGEGVTNKATALLNQHFNGVIKKAKVNSIQYANLTKNLLDALIAKS